MPRTLRAVSLASALAVALALGGAGVAAAEEAHHPQEGAASEVMEGAEMNDDAAGAGSTMMMRCEPMTKGAKMGRGMMHGGMKGEREGGQGMMMGKTMHDGMMGHGMMHGGEGAMGQGMAGKAYHGPHRLLSVDEVTKRLEAMIAGHKRLKVAKVEPGGDFSFAADVTTIDGSLVHKLLIDRRDGMVWDAE